jgi:hypothetical protein
MLAQRRTTAASEMIVPIEPVVAFTFIRFYRFLVSGKFNRNWLRAFDCNFSIGLGDLDASDQKGDDAENNFGHVISAANRVEKLAHGKKKHPYPGNPEEVLGELQ